MNKAFFDVVRPHFGKLTTGQVAGMEKIIAEGKERGMSAFHLANVLSQVKHETANWMEPIREGCRRQGPAGTEAQAVSAIQAAINKGLIKPNYLVAVNGHRYYGRGLIQITWEANYKKFGIENYPDAALAWCTSLDILFDGLIKGLFTGKKLSDWGDARSDVSRRKAWREMRGMVNGDVKSMGKSISDSSAVFYAALVAGGY